MFSGNRKRRLRQQFEEHWRLVIIQRLKNHSYNEMYQLILNFHVDLNTDYTMYNIYKI